MKVLIFIFVVSVWFFLPGFAQQQATQEEQTEQTAQTEQVAQPGETTQADRKVIDLTKLGKAYKFSGRVELPQVKVIDRRISPEFKDLTAEKSFSNELSPQVEQIRYEPITSGRVKPIENIESLLNKKRF